MAKNCGSCGRYVLAGGCSYTCTSEYEHWIGKPALKKRVFILNGPPGSGKDTIVAGMANYTFGVLSFKTKLIELTLALYDVTREEWDLRYDKVADGERYKELSWDKLGGRSQRSALIHVSETIVKPNFSSDYFGVAAVKAIKECAADTIVFTDGGFLDETDILGKKFDVTVVHVYREGYDFSNDSRDYVYSRFAATTCLNVMDGDVMYGINQLAAILEFDKN